VLGGHGIAKFNAIYTAVVHTYIRVFVYLCIMHSNVLTMCVVMFNTVVIV